MSEQLIKALRALPRYDYGYRDDGWSGSSVLTQWRSDQGPFVQYDDLENALSTHHAAPGAPQQETSGELFSLIDPDGVGNANTAAVDRAAATAPAGGVTEALREAAQWLHAAYGRPPVTPDCAAMLKRVDAALTPAARAAEPDTLRMNWLREHSHPLTGAVEILMLSAGAPPTHLYGEGLDAFVDGAIATSPTPPTGTSKEGGEK